MNFSLNSKATLDNKNYKCYCIIGIDKDFKRIPPNKVIFLLSLDGAPLFCQPIHHKLSCRDDTLAVNLNIWIVNNKFFTYKNNDL